MNFVSKGNGMTNLIESWLLEVWMSACDEIIDFQCNTEKDSKHQTSKSHNPIRLNGSQSNCYSRASDSEIHRYLWICTNPWMRIFLTLRYPLPSTNRR